MIQRTIPLVALSLTIATSRAASSQTEPASQIPDVRTTASAGRSVRPDVATFSLSFNASGRTPLGAGQVVAARADSIRTSLVRLGMPRDSLASGYQSYWDGRRIEVVTTPHVVSISNGSRYIQGMDTSYRASDVIHVRIHELRLVGPAIDSAMAHAVTEISSVRFEATDITG